MGLLVPASTPAAAPVLDRCEPRVAAAPSLPGPTHFRCKHARFSLFGPPNCGLSRQYLHAPQLGRTQPAHFLHRFVLEFLVFFVAALPLPSALTSGPEMAAGAETTAGSDVDGSLGN